MNLGCSSFFTWRVVAWITKATVFFPRMSGKTFKSLIKFTPISRSGRAISWSVEPVQFLRILLYLVPYSSGTDVARELSEHAESLGISVADASENNDHCKFRSVESNRARLRQKAPVFNNNTMAFTTEP